MTYISTYKNKSINWGRIIITIVVTLYMLFYLNSLSEWHFIDNVNLIFHEAGHIIFGFFGEFIKFLGGTLMQLLIPAIFSVYFFRKGDNFSASLLLFWLGQNFLNVSVYAGDALSMELPLLGGGSVIHDWNYLLSTINILKYTDQVSLFLYFVGIIILIFAMVFSVQSSIKNNYTIKV